jgi:dTDP-4-amino-4,6-dideoxygalactose transaminase
MNNNDLIDNGQLTIDNANNNCPLSILNCQLSMVDLHRQYLRLKPDVDRAMQQVLESTAFINGPQVKEFATNFANYLNIPYVIPCGNGTDALQIALMALDLRPGDEVIVPAFTYVAAAEVVALLGLIPVWVDVEPETFNINPSLIEGAVSPRTKAIVAVHLFGQSCDMEPILRIASQNNLYVIEDNAQSVGAVYTFSDGTKKKTGTMGHIGTTSFFPSKPLACYGDGGAIMTSDSYWAERLRMIASHGQQIKYHHKIVGCNSRLDTLQAAVLNVKLPHLDAFNEARRQVATRYDEALGGNPLWTIPERRPYSTHVYHQYTLRVKDGKRDELQAYLKEQGIPSMIYYPLPLQKQEAFYGFARKGSSLHVAEQLTKEVLSLPIHTEMTDAEIDFIIDKMNRFTGK